MGRQEEYAEKRRRIAELMARFNLDGLLLQRSGSVSWALCGAETHVALNSEAAAAAVLYTSNADYLLADRIELPRFQAEELADLPLSTQEYPWYLPGNRDTLIQELVGGGRIGSDSGSGAYQLLANELGELRASLTPEEQERLRGLGQAAGQAICQAAGEISPGMDEYQIAGSLAEECFLRDITPVVLLVAVDERIRQFRHPIPTPRQLERMAMMVLCARRHGLIVSVTRLVHFGPLDDELRRRMLACAMVDAQLHAVTQPGRALAEIFDTLNAAYAAQGFAGEWQLHHQGGPAGYENRELLLTPNVSGKVQEHQAFAWNPSISGVKSEDTILVASGQSEVLTAAPQWPLLEIEVDSQVFQRPAILEVL